MKYKKATMQHLHMSIIILLLLAFLFPLDAVAGLSAVAPPISWKVSNKADSKWITANGSFIDPVLDNSIMSYTTYFGFYSIDGKSFILSIVISGPQAPVIWSANPENPVNSGAILNFTREGNLILHNGDGTTVWSTATKSKSVAGMVLDVYGNLVLFDKDNISVWQSFDHPTDTLVLGQSLCRGMNLSIRTSNTKWPSARVYFSAEWNGLQYSFKPAAFTKLFETSTIASTCCAFANGSFGFPDNIFFLPSARSLQFMRLESDGHLRLYEMQGTLQDPLMLFDVLSTEMKFCDYPMACGDYGVCSKGQCSCPNLNDFRFQNERLPSAGCIPLRSPSCDHVQDNNNRLILLNNVLYFSNNTFLSFATSTSEDVCKQSCLIDCSCKVVLFRTNNNFSDSPSTNNNVSDSGYCLLLSEQMVILFAEDSSNHFSAFLKIEGNRSDKRRISIVVGSIAGFCLISILVCAMVWKNCKKDKEPLFDGIPGIPKRFSFDELKVATGHFSIKLGAGGFGSVFKGKIGKETIAVKRLEGVEQGMEEFLAEVKTIGRIHHFNLVRLVGFCAEKSHRLLVYEYLSNGSLDKWIFHKSPVFTLSWKTRRHIILAIARGLSYLHEECEEKIAHLDIKPQNILLDDRFNAKVSDFGLSKMINRDQSKVMTRMRGTRGYLAPEWLGSKITEKADIYSFGIVMIEIICGRENLDESQPDESIHLISLLQEKARSGQLSDLVDSSSNDMKFHLEEVVEAMKLAMWCLQVDSSRRPLLSTVAKVLEGVMSMETTPDCTFVPSFASNKTNVEGSTSSYVTSESHLSGPR
ncbi:G-type lectin S-receptor-like serine/threonine-protein kinase SD2-5 [Sorghum bicolor]|uniref:Receptor-like serine/threonine-protein kinase n=2 Tax=Sorghum bicolor TaxID=4558 RepID=A0A1B6QJ70_SORBI|nr:G-type lectin S-receptor-like serine/threonine-protein kinase SD2-5 [Sorghum bicolor]KXG37964.1 hypothetical protein SORBI_3001G159200 [Sorghum bicolor]|eukprot:XP_002464192.2 G-type lectin S-receptor-like serine/threonine-protein kinase SD2-5 [Sorghum bicolor]